MSPRNKRLAAMAGRVGPVLCWDTDASYYACVTTGHCHLYDSQQYFEELIRGVEMDLTIHRYPTFSDLEQYCYRVASVVGLMCIEILWLRPCRRPRLRPQSRYRLATH